MAGTSGAPGVRTSGAPGAFVRVRGGPVHVLVEGAGPAVVLTAGLGLGWFDWDEVVPLLTPHRTVLRFDRPGHGLSAPAAVPPTCAGEADRIRVLLDRLGLGPATVVGHSLAGFHAEAFVRRYPGLAAGLVLLDASVEERPRAGAAAGLPALRTAVHTLAARGLGALAAAAGAPAALGPALRRAAVRPDRATPEQAHCYRTSRVWRGVLLENARYRAMADELLALRARRPLPPGLPVTVLAAYDGRALGPGLRWLARQAALADTLGARFEVAEPAGHLVMHDRPRQVARAVLDC
ncbi:alpha/beta hydrolase [Streptomyces sp. NPDC089919]|uniref:alpha/beta fold hydrolase n=1 Tax=Streptomyces sp. NPDC089919 TaxID=3155188 RepID=UPI00341A11EB